jgi:hypothetical protein
MHSRFNMDSGQLYWAITAIRRTPTTLDRNHTHNQKNIASADRASITCDNFLFKLSCTCSAQAFMAARRDEMTARVAHADHT